MIYLLDTNHCSRIIFGNRSLIQQLQAHREDSIATIVIVRGELLFMVQKSQQKAKNLNAVGAFLQNLSLYPISSAVANVYGELKGEIVNQLGPKSKTRRRRTTIQELGFSDNDLWIAATVINYNLTLVSSDRDFQRLQLLKAFSLESWL